MTQYERPRIRYFALGTITDDPVEQAGGMMREVQGRGAYRLERVDRNGRWVLDYELLRYLTGNDDAYEQITPQQAAEIAKRLGASL